MQSNAIKVVASPADWRELLVEEIARHPRGKAGVAARLDVSRAYVSRVMSSGSSQIAAVSPKFIDRVLGLCHVIFCPAVQKDQPRDECHKANAPAPTHNPQAMRVWRHCQTCALKPLSAPLPAKEPS